MKLKFRAEPQDVLIFVMFAIFLLFIIAIGVVNIGSLASEGRFAGINPFPAFSPRFFATTLCIYFICLLLLMLSVSSYFFEMEEGFGFSTKKKDKGYSRWAKDKEMKAALYEVDPKAPHSEHAGVTLVSKNGKLWVDDGEFHTLVMGATGSGKTQSLVFPTMKVLAKKGESMVLTDPKGELFEKTGDLLRRKGYNIILLNFRNPQKGNAWNPMTLPYRLYQEGNTDKAIELLDDLALNILYDEKNSGQDPFWEKSGADYFSGIALGLFDDAPEEEININSISMTTTVGEEKCGGSTYVQEYFNMKDPNSPAYVNASGTITAPSDTKGSILSVFKQKIKLFASRENLSEMLSYSDFDMASIGERPTAVFIIIQDEKKTYHSLATIFVKQCYETLIDVAQANGGKLPVRTNFILDEFANMPPLKDVTTMITAARSRQIRFTLIIQNFAQLNQVYGKENAETIKGNCGNIVYLISTELQALEEISKLCGEVKSKKDDKTASTPLVTVSDLQRMKQFDQIVLRMRMQPFKTSFTPDFKIDWGNERSGKIEYPERVKRELKVFDVREFVKKKRQEKIKSMMMDNNTPPTSGTQSTPFGGGGAFSRPRPDEGQSSAFNPFAKETKTTTTTTTTSKVTESKPTVTPIKEEKSSQSIDIDELVKKIDAKIAEIEKEEENEKKAGVLPTTVSNEKKVVSTEVTEKKEENKEPFISSKAIEDKVNQIINNQERRQEPVVQNSTIIEKTQPVVEKTQPVVEKPQPVVEKTTIINKEEINNNSPAKPSISLDEVSDEQFFDDFFEE